MNVVSNSYCSYKINSFLNKYNLKISVLPYGKKKSKIEKTFNYLKNYKKYKVIIKYKTYNYSFIYEYRFMDNREKGFESPYLLLEIMDFIIRVLESNYSLTDFFEINNSYNKYFPSLDFIKNIIIYRKLKKIQKIFYKIFTEKNDLSNFIIDYHNFRQNFIDRITG